MIKSLFFSAFVVALVSCGSNENLCFPVVYHGFVSDTIGDSTLFFRSHGEVTISKSSSCWTLELRDADFLVCQAFADNLDIQVNPQGDVDVSLQPYATFSDHAWWEDRVAQRPYVMVIGDYEFFMRYERPGQNADFYVEGGKLISVVWFNRKLKRFLRASTRN